MSQEHSVYNKPRVRAAKAGDCPIIAANMREEDRLEIFYSSGSSPLEALQRGLRLSEICKVIVINEEPVAMFGIGRNTLQPYIGIPWMLATPELSRIKKSFLRRVRGELHKLSFGFRVLANSVWSGNSVHILWLKWMGFTVQDTRPVTHNGQLFYAFWKDVTDV